MGQAGRPGSAAVLLNSSLASASGRCCGSGRSGAGAVRVHWIGEVPCACGRGVPPPLEAGDGAALPACLNARARSWRWAASSPPLIHRAGFMGGVLARCRLGARAGSWPRRSCGGRLAGRAGRCRARASLAGNGTGSPGRNHAALSLLTDQARHHTCGRGHSIVFSSRTAPHPVGPSPRGCTGRCMDTGGRRATRWERSGVITPSVGHPTSTRESYRASVRGPGGRSVLGSMPLSRQ